MSNSPFKLGSHVHGPAGRFFTRRRSGTSAFAYIALPHSSPNGRRYCKMTCSSVRTAYHVSQDCTMIRLKSACPCGMLLTPPTSRAMSCQGCRDSLFAPLLISAYNNDHRHSFVKETGVPKERKGIGFPLKRRRFRLVQSMAPRSTPVAAALSLWYSTFLQD